MIGFLSLASLGLGVTLAGVAPRAGSRVAACETCAGLLLVAGLAVLGSGLPLFR
ncbi:hypothetical protein [Methylobacterium nigriterrae]|uniref:hypothetical protein n=1 Tax=Methylobacterium nigriterrae TaxID=3127512 RepID=UPI00301326A4